jgi:hypothetical protein
MTALLATGAQGYLSREQSLLTRRVDDSAIEPSPAVLLSRGQVVMRADIAHSPFSH